MSYNNENSLKRMTNRCAKSLVYQRTPNCLRRTIVCTFIAGTELLYDYPIIFLWHVRRLCNSKFNGFSSGYSIEIFEYARCNNIPKSILRLYYIYSFESKTEKNNDYVNLKRYRENYWFRTNYWSNCTRKVIVLLRYNYIII